ncbi:nucleotidyltransferase family protein [Flagellimonas sediminis]|uniref:NTP transferase domain-containing protein n=1 Tax=Flagellimonas sediminis TaxID=2696468 RepID=A0A6I5KUZ9_9FLAO|nr:nucleotidyltransferase family protein [Allomuricauda sediminis]NDV44764.1 NTP transferase domain-containing protein [Allomuricauda sediminis]
MSKTAKIGVVILAAGGSSRLGRPKQLVKFKGKPLLQHTIDLVEKLDFNKKILVLGSHEDLILNEVDIKNFEVVQNPEWEKGMAGSIKIGLQELTRDTELEHILLLLSDQPMLTTEYIQRLSMAHVYQKPMATYSKYGSELGVPAIFSKSAFTFLENLKGDQGAKKLTMNADFVYRTIEFEQGGFDIDTEADVEKLKGLE